MSVNQPINPQFPIKTKKNSIKNIHGIWKKRDKKKRGYYECFVKINVK
jgi:hypothetical protein